MGQTITQLLRWRVSLILMWAIGRLLFVKSLRQHVVLSFPQTRTNTFWRWSQ